MSEQEFIEVVQIIEKDEPDVQPSQGQEEGEEEQAKPDAVALAGLHLLFGIFLPVAAVQAVEAAGPDGAAAGGICHGEGLLLSEQASCSSASQLLSELSASSLLQSLAQPHWSNRCHCCHLQEEVWVLLEDQERLYGPSTAMVARWVRVS